MNFIVEAAVRAGLMKLLGHAISPSLVGGHPNIVSVENAWIEQVMAFVEGKTSHFPMPPSWLLIGAIMPEAELLAETAMQIAGSQKARVEVPPVAAKERLPKPPGQAPAVQPLEVEQKSPVSDAGKSQESIAPSVSEEKE